MLDGGGAFAMIDEMKRRLVQSHAERVRRIEVGAIPVVGVNRFTETADSPLVRALDGESSILVVDREAEAEQLERLATWRTERDASAVSRTLDELRRVASTDENLVPVSVALGESRRHGRRMGRHVARGVR